LKITSSCNISNETPRRRDSGVSSGKNYYLKNPPNPLLQKGVQGIPTAETVGYKNLIKILLKGTEGE